ncbi:hypothetical protein EBO34_08740 [Alteribacter keqinensis]|uniref:Uncharacterized protein n=1 Tax=Alteribacter keqinensis TaxID=2483800 RepID=A0A3M7TWG9_9BACI|nr:hypothetical protein EBO34_08740 [Alteribacter keqinensis]
MKFFSRIKSELKFLEGESPHVKKPLPQEAAFSLIIQSFLDLCQPFRLLFLLTDNLILETLQALRNRTYSN